MVQGYIGFQVSGLGFGVQGVLGFKDWGLGPATFGRWLCCVAAGVVGLVV